MGEIIFQALFGAKIMDYFALPERKCEEFELDKLDNKDIKKRNHEFSNSPIHEFKVLHKGQRSFYNPFLMVHYFLFYLLF